MGTPYTFDEGMSCHSTRIELFYFDDNFRRIALWVRPLKLGYPLDCLLWSAYIYIYKNILGLNRN